MEAVKVGKRGAIVVPAKLRKRYGIEEGTVVTGRGARRWSVDPPGGRRPNRTVHARAQS